MWSDLAKIHHFGKKFYKSFATLWKASFVFGKLLNLLCANFLLYWYSFIAVISQIWKRNIAIWSHCSVPSDVPFFIWIFSFASIKVFSLFSNCFICDSHNLSSIFYTLFRPIFYLFLVKGFKCTSLNTVQSHLSFTQRRHINYFLNFTFYQCGQIKIAKCL